MFQKFMRGMAKLYEELYITTTTTSMDLKQSVWEEVGKLGPNLQNILAIILR